MAAAFFRSFSSRLRRKAPAPGLERSASCQKLPSPIDPRKQVCCKILLLDGTDLQVVVSKRSLAAEVYEQVFYSLDIDERDYFGLQYTDHCQIQHWLDPLKRVRKQVAIGPPYTFRLRVKFFTSEPAMLREEITKYLFFLHIKQDVATGRLPCSPATAAELAALSLQSELGYYNPLAHTPLFVSEFRFHPEQDEEMEINIVEQFKACRGQTPAQAELNYLNLARTLEMYGVDMHIVEGKDGNKYSLGLTPLGMLVYDGPQKIGLFFWERMKRLDFKSRKLTLVVEEDADQKTNEVQQHTFVFNLANAKACKHLWKCAIEQHSFFRLKVRVPERQSRSQLFRLGSTFRYRGRTEYENMHKERQPRRSASAFERRPSQRFNPRLSHATRREANNARRNELRQQVISQITSSPSTSESRCGSTPVGRNASASPPRRVPFSPFENVTQQHTKTPSPERIAAAESRLDRLLGSPLPPPLQAPPSSSSSTASSTVSSIASGSQQPGIAAINRLPAAPTAAPPPPSLPTLAGEPRRPPHVTTIPVGDQLLPVASSTLTTSLPPEKLSSSRIPKYSAQIQIQRTPSPSPLSSSADESTPLTAPTPTPPSAPETTPSPFAPPTADSTESADPTNITTTTSQTQLTAPLPPHSNIPRLSKSKLAVAPAKKADTPSPATTPSEEMPPPTSNISMSRIPKMTSAGAPATCAQSTTSFTSGSNLRLPTAHGRVTTQL